jgi:uncharacterized protein (TIGR00369 family)
MSEHHRKLERMYLAAPINQIFRPTIAIEPGRATIESEVRPEHFHAAGALHGAVYFKSLDDAAFFAASSQVEGRFVLTVSFTVYFTRPVTEGRLRAEGRVVSRSRSLLVAEAVLRADEREAARGSGTFLPGPNELSEALGYR